MQIFYVEVKLLGDIYGPGISERIEKVLNNFAKVRSIYLLKEAEGGKRSEFKIYFEPDAEKITGDIISDVCSKVGEEYFEVIRVSESVTWKNVR